MKKKPFFEDCLSEERRHYWSKRLSKFRTPGRPLVSLRVFLTPRRYLTAKDVFYLLVGMLLYKKRKKEKKKEHVRATPNQEMGPNCVKKKTKWRMDFPEGFARPTSSSMGPIFGGSGQVILGRLANRNGSRIGVKK